MTLTGTNTYTGGTYVDQGTVILTGSLASYSITSIGSAGTLQIGSGGAAGSVNADIADNGNLVFDLCGSPTFADWIGGSGGLTQKGGGTLILTDTNSYSGTTTISAGTLQAGAEDALSPYSDMTVDDNCTLDLAGFDNSIGAFSGSSGSLVENLGADTATLTVAGYDADTTFSGVLQDGAAGKLALTKDGSDTLTLTGANNYTGGTTISGGTLQLGNAAALGPTGNSLTVSSGGGLDLHGYSLGVGASRCGGYRQPFRHGHLHADRRQRQRQQHLLGNDPGHFWHDRPGEDRHGDANSQRNQHHSGDTTILAGTLQVGNGTEDGSFSSSLVSISSDSNLVFDPDYLMTYSGSITGGGGVETTGTGTLTLTGQNNYTGGTTIIWGSTLQADTGDVLGSGDIDDNGWLCFSPSTSMTVTNTISGSGFLATNCGTLTLSGDNTYTGGTFLYGGVLSISNDNNLGDSSGGLTFYGGTLQTAGDNLQPGRHGRQVGGGTVDTDGNTEPPVAPSPAAVD